MEAQSGNSQGSAVTAIPGNRGSVLLLPNVGGKNAGPQPLSPQIVLFSIKAKQIY